MNEQGVFVLADRALDHVVQQIGDGQWDMTMPASFARRGEGAPALHCSFGDFAAREYFWQTNGFRGMRAWDIARAIGVDPSLPDDLVQGLWDELSPVADAWRAYGVFPAAVPVPKDAPLMERLLGITGRDPR
jgi:hypothetical protein